MKRLARFVRARLHRRLFVWIGITILATLFTVSAVAWIVAPRTMPYKHMYMRTQSFVGGQIAAVWDEPERRDALLASAARDLDVDLVLEDASGRTLAAHGDECERARFQAPVVRDGVTLGKLRVCIDRGGRRPFFTVLSVLGIAFATLWVATGLIARRLVRPLGELVRVANAIGAGNLQARARMRQRQYGEIGVLGDAINDMAARIERQMADQRELLAAVSHEIRSPLSRMRVLTELARQDQGRAQAIDEIEREVEDIDSLVGQLLASSRLDFSALEPRRLDARDVALRCLERAGLSQELLSLERKASQIDGDPTLLARALDNLLDNAKKHGGGVRALSILDRDGKLAFAVDDNGPGFADGDVERVFESFVRGERSAGSSLGLGLALVRRIARAHGGDAWAENRAGGGARVGFWLGKP